MDGTNNNSSEDRSMKNADDVPVTTFCIRSSETV